MYKMLLALAVVAVMACGAVAGEVSQATLGDMGLANMQTMSDDEGMAVRGAFAIVGGFSFASTPGAASGDAYAAGDFGWGPDLAFGGSSSQSQTIIFNDPPGPPILNSTTVITATASGGAFAFAGW
jgi:hypothetical protein